LFKQKVLALICPKAKPQVGEIEVIRDGKTGRRGARWYKVTFTFTLDFLTLKGLST